jgi:hypothetical protein
VRLHGVDKGMSLAYQSWGKPHSETLSEGERVVKSSKPEEQLIRRRQWRFAAVAVLVMLTPSSAMAYIDPISGSIVLQVLAAGFFAGSLAFRRVRDGIAEGFRSIARRIRR